MTKFKQYFQQMVDQESELFSKFKVIHDGYVEDRKTYSKDFHEVGKQVIEVIHTWEQKLCCGMERGKNAVYSDKLADKFWAEVKTLYSHIDLVGVKSNLD